jgi:hypothetical protein
MTIKPNGDFLVNTGEIITVTVKASDTQYLAAFSDLSSGSWILTSLPNVPPDPLSEVRQFVMIGTVNSFDIQFGFLPPPGTAPASYHVAIAGNAPGGATFADDIFPPASPLPPDRDYTFVTSVLSHK